MCGLFGFTCYGSPVKGITGLTNTLAEYSAIRGTDATGIAYCTKQIHINKGGKSAYAMNFKVPENVKAVIGHTRHATSGDYKNNYNNHPFFGKTGNTRFALAHNGVLMSVDSTRRTHNLPEQKIKTDSYLAVQLLEKEKSLTFDSIRAMTGKISGSFAFSILDDRNNIWLIRGDNPISILHFPEKRMYVYASTDEILYKSIVDSFLFEDMKHGRYEEILIPTGTIMKIKPSGEIERENFIFREHISPAWWEFGYFKDPYAVDPDEEYLRAIKTAASYQGIEEETIDELLNAGYTLDELAEELYCEI
ncbi:MAG: class II glutamine amidotransferase [Clostridia bacterium]|nr:class II glutamine amidotransferase [Clostridia bacterium]